MDANPSGLARRPESHCTGEGSATTTKEETCAGGEAQVPLQRQRWLEAANPSKWLKSRTNDHDPCGSRIASERHDPCGSHAPSERHDPCGSPTPSGPMPTGPRSAGPNARGYGAAHLCGSGGARVGAAAWIVEVTGGSAAAWIVRLTVSPAAAWIVVVSAALQPL